MPTTIAAGAHSPTSLVPSTLNCPDDASTVFELVMMSSSPCTAVSMPSVTMNAFTPTTWTSTPFTAPTPTPMPSAVSVPSIMPWLLATIRPAAPHSPAVAPTDRSKLPVISSTVMLMTRTPSSAD